MNDSRPDPDQLLARVQATEALAERGRLTIFFGANAGVGKTYAMLEAARTERDLKRDVVLGKFERALEPARGVVVRGNSRGRIARRLAGNDRRFRIA